MQTFFLCDSLNKGEHTEFLVFQYSGQNLLLSPQAVSYSRITPFSSQKTVTVIVPADGTFLNVLFHRDDVWCHSFN